MLEIVRGLVRPIVTIVLVMAVLAFLWFGVAIPDRLWDMALMGLAFWFGSRITGK